METKWCFSSSPPLSVHIKSTQHSVAEICLKISSTQSILSHTSTTIYMSTYMLNEGQESSPSYHFIDFHLHIHFPVKPRMSAAPYRPLTDFVRNSSLSQGSALLPHQLVNRKKFLISSVFETYMLYILMLLAFKVLCRELFSDVLISPSIFCLKTQAQMKD